jgi:hypothetical protein
MAALLKALQRSAALAPDAHRVSDSAYGLQRKPRTERLASEKAPVITPAALIATGTVNIEFV